MMKKILSIMLTVALALTMFICSAIPVSAAAGDQNGDSLTVVQPAGGAYVIVTNLVPGDLDFKYGWHNANQFASAAVGYWIGVYDITASHYVWCSENPFTELNPKKLELKSLDTSTLVSGHEYAINFFVRCNYAEVLYENVTEVQVYFTAP
jgi:hypothetical protein